MKLVKWSFGKYGTEGYVTNKELALTKNLTISKGLYEGLIFSISGLGLSKSERELFESKIFERRDNINIYLGKIIISHNRKGYRAALSSCKIDFECDAFKYLKNHLYYSYISKAKNKVKSKVNIMINKFFKKFVFKEKELFTIQEYWEKPKTIKCDRLTAYQIASNYEADLLDRHGRYLLSPLGFDWSENKNLIVKNLGKFFNNFKLYGYSNWYDPNVEIIKE